DINVLINNIKTSNFDYNWIHGCGKVFTQCLNEDFLHNFMYGASSLSFFYSAADKLNYSIFDQKSNNEYATPYQAILLLADKYRSEIDYPILSDEPTLWQRALFSDMIVNYSRKNNLAQSDLGSWVVPESQVEKGHAANYKHPSVTSELKSFSVGSSNSQWTTTGWYTLPGQTVTLTRTDDTENTVTLKLNYLNDSYPRTDRTHTLYLPQRLTTYPTTLQKGQTYSFSSPYGGPIYLMFSNTEEVTIQAEGVAHHPSIDDYSSPAQIERFLNLLESTETPHIDIKLTGFEYHTKKHKLLNSIDETITVPTIEDSRGRYPSIESLISSIYDDAYKSIFGLIGVKLGNEKLADTLSADVKEICVAIAGADACFDENLHRQRSIQHVNFVDQARCGSGCSGNPADIQDDVSTTSWIVGHEIGHNLQTKNLDVGYTNDAENWKNFRSAVGEASNNIFPHVTQWRAHYERNKATELFKEGHANHIDLFNAYMSDLEEFKNEKGERIIFDVACGIGKGDRYNAMWVNEKQQQRHSYRLSFYIQMAMLADKKIMFNGTRLNNGYDIYTLVYQMSRLFDLYSIDEKSWEDNKSKLGFELFPYEGHATYDSLNIKDIPGNDFLLVALSKITALDWTPFWDLYGLRYSSLAHNQVKQNASKGVLEKGIYVIDATLPPHQLTDELDFLPLEDTPKMWPTTFATPRGCLGFTLPGKAQDPIELKENGKTLAVRTNSGAMVGEEYEFDGKKYIIANKDLLKHYKGDYANVITTYVTNLDILFFWNHEFNDDISSWDTSNVTSMFNTFRENYQFNQNISFWDTSKVTNMEATLMNAVNFDQDISNWDVRNVTEHTLFEANTPIQGTEKMPKFNQ
ncbi:BspA family leucine-rich repeat surface protein, partial [Vibrio vulnificus]|nr:BspA family leucine-rich repeat surface protein [Vibrio vulnificus]